MTTGATIWLTGLPSAGKTTIACELTGLTGVDDPYEAPESPDLRIESHTQTVRESAAALHALLVERGLV